MAGRCRTLEAGDGGGASTGFGPFDVPVELEATLNCVRILLDFDKWRVYTSCPLALEHKGGH